MTFPSSKPSAGCPCVVGTTATIFETVCSRLIRTCDGLIRMTSVPNGACTFCAVSMMVRSPGITFERSTVVDTCLGVMSFTIFAAPRSRTSTVLAASPLFPFAPAHCGIRADFDADFRRCLARDSNPQRHRKSEREQLQKPVVVIQFYGIHVTYPTHARRVPLQCEACGSFCVRMHRVNGGECIRIQESFNLTIVSE